MHPGDASLSPIPDVPSGDERSDHDTPKRHPREGAKVSVYNYNRVRFLYICRALGHLS